MTSTVIITVLQCVTAILLCSVITINGYNAHKRFEYKLSFKGPHLVQRDGSIPFWEHGGHAIASDESIRITPSLRSKKGHVWSKETNPHQNWEIEVTFRVSGRGRIGADGLAIWYTQAASLAGGPVFGSADQWNGLAVFFDSFDNDNQKNNPYVMSMVNDGTKTYDHQTDGSSQQLGGCLRDFRNKPFPIKAKIEYYQRSLTVSINNGMTNHANDYELCLRVENVDLPTNGHFGISAATGGLADDHDVQSFITHSLTPPADAPVTEQVPEEERKRFEQEFDDYWKKLQQAKEDFQKEHPDVAIDGDDGRYYESQDVREMKQIFEGQNAIHNTVRNLHSKLDEVIGRQERTLSQVSMLGNQVMPQAQGQQGQQQQQGGQVPAINRHEVDTLLNNQRELVQTMRDLRNIVNEVNQRTSGIQSQVTSGAGGGGGGGGIDHTNQLSELRNYLTNVQTDVRTLIGRPQTQNACPPPPEPSCVSTFYFIAFGLMQVMMILGYIMYRSSKEAAAKKFY